MKDDCQGYEPWWEAANSDKKGTARKKVLIIWFHGANSKHQGPFRI